jgi:plasmid stability protein
MYGMFKTTVYIPEDLKAALEKMAAGEGRSEAEIIREAIRATVAGRRLPRPRIPLCAKGLGNPVASERVDELLRDFGSE